MEALWSVENEKKEEDGESILWVAAEEMWNIQCR